MSAACAGPGVGGRGERLHCDSALGLLTSQNPFPTPENPPLLQHLVRPKVRSWEPKGSRHGALRLLDADPQRPDGGAGGDNQWRGAVHSEPGILGSADTPECPTPAPGGAATHCLAWGRGRGSDLTCAVFGGSTSESRQGYYPFWPGSHNIYITIGPEF